MANRNVEVFDNVFDQNGTANVMIVGYRYDYKDPNYQPLPKAIVARQSARQGGLCPRVRRGRPDRRRAWRIVAAGAVGRRGRRGGARRCGCAVARPARREDAAQRSETRAREPQGYAARAAARNQASASMEAWLK
jgi:hypothetical protein